MKAPIEMHIPDGFLSLPVAIVFWLISIIFIFIALKRTQKELSEKQVPLVALLAAAIFAGQMLNFSVSGGTSGHLLGAALSVILLGPWTAVLVMTSVVAVQAIVFQDGGLIVLGANLFNMAVLGVAVSEFFFQLMGKGLRKFRTQISMISFFTGWASIFIASLSAAIQLALSGTSPANISLPAMAGIHAIIGVGEGLITAAAVNLVSAARPELIEQREGNGLSTRGFWISGFLLTLILLIFSPFASSHPDGLEWVAENLNFLDRAQDPLYQIIPDYVFPGISNEGLATIIAGLIGVIIVGGIAFSLINRQIATSKK